MRKLLLFFGIVFLLLYGLVYYAKNGQLEKYLDAHPASMNVKIEYYWGMLLSLINDKNAAGRF
jgi:hypothetical protein